MAVFRCKQSYFSLPHVTLFESFFEHFREPESGLYIPIPCDPVTHNPDVQKCIELGVPAPGMAGRSYCFFDGEKKNLLTVHTQVEVDALRDYISRRGDDFIMEV